MGTIPKISSHSPFATEAAYGVRLLLFWPVVIPDPRIGFYNPGLSGFAYYGRTLQLSFPMPRRGSGTKCHSGPDGSSRRNHQTVSGTLGPKPFFSEALWLSRRKNVSGFVDLLNIRNRSSLVQTSARLVRRPGGLTETDLISIKKFFPSPHLLSSLLSLTW